jgi:CO dehydrogenase/acetyl-CoA synthase gamma subunit (corrinoid Fe-S protein)
MIEQEFADLYPLTAENLVEYLPTLDCRECGFPSCQAFAGALLGRRTEAAAKGPDRMGGSVTGRACPELDEGIAAIIDALAAFQLPRLPYNCMMESFPPGLIRMGDPEPTSPVLITGNFQETVRLLESIFHACAMPAFLVMSDTRGYSIDNAIVEKRFTPFEILKVITETEIGSLTSHRNLVIPGLARHLASQIKQATSWRVEVGPVSGMELPLFLVTEGIAPR